MYLFQTCELVALHGGIELKLAKNQIASPSTSRKKKQLAFHSDERREVDSAKYPIC